MGRASRQPPISVKRGSRPGVAVPRYFRGDLGCNIVPVQFLEPQRHSQIFFMRAVCASSRVMP
jgi:hypothetical protein